jgi:hypothetical protein
MHWVYRIRSEGSTQFDLPQTEFKLHQTHVRPIGSPLYNVVRHCLSA